MSSTKFSAELRPDDTLRKVVVLSGVIAAIAGLSLIMHMPLSAIHRVISCAVWLVWCGIEISALTKVWPNVSRIGVNSAGEVWVTDAAGQRVTATLLRGSIVIRRLAWLRLRLEDGRKYAELVSGNAVEDDQWHRFQLIWKQSRQIVGRAERS
jgi:hypothetical protein